MSKTYTGRIRQQTTLTATDGTSYTLPVGTKLLGDDAACDAEENEYVTVTVNGAPGTVLRWYISF